MTAVLQGFRILEVAEHTFVPAASALLADWGADVIKIEHVERGDAMRGLAATGVAVDLGSGVNVLLEHSNRGKRSLGLDLKSPDGIAILYQIAATADVFLTNKLPAVRASLKIDVDDIRAHNRNIVYVRGTGQGERGPDANKGSYDSLAFWARSGAAISTKRPGHDDFIPVPPAPGFGDAIGAMTIAGGIMGALLHRDRTGHAAIVDVSLLGTGLWAMAQAISLSLLLDIPWEQPPENNPRQNPLTRMYRTKDDRTIYLTSLQAGKYWPTLCHAIGRPELADDPRFADQPSILANCLEAYAALAEVFAQGTLDEWRERLASFDGQWAVVQNTVEAAVDPQTIANEYVQECTDADGQPFHLVTAPVQFDETAATPRRAPEFNEHGDQILAELGFDDEALIDLKLRGVVA